MSALVARPLDAGSFAPFGEVIAAQGAFATINAGACRRYSDLATLDIAEGRAGLSLFQAELRAPPYRCTLLERHPLGSQCFIPMGPADWLVIVAPDAGGVPGPAQAFRAGAAQAVNIGRGVWHGVLCPIGGSGLFAVIDRIGPGPNLEEHPLAEPLEISL